MLRSLSLRAMAALPLVALPLAAGSAADIKFPRTVVWTAYDVGGAGYSQVVAIGSIVKNKYGANIRILPGKNDVARLSPLRDNRASFSATGSDSIYAQEGVFVFGTKQWGPQPIRILSLNVADGCAVAFTTSADAGLKTVKDLKGKPVAVVTSSPALVKATEAMLAHAGMTLKDVKVVPVSSIPNGIDALINGNALTIQNASFSSHNKRLEASPRGVTYLPIPHADEAGWKRLNKIVPWYFKHRCMAGPGVPKGGYEGVGTGYPILVAMNRVKADLAYNTTKLMFVHYNDYKSSAPGANGWALERQQLETYFMPFHDGAIKYYKEVGKWTAKAQANHEANLKRQQVLQGAWKAFIGKAPSDAKAFKAAWAKARAAALEAAKLEVVFQSW
ncbi:MAG: TAXI family TRAP transporter solute-binding subunit [Hyphomicrobiaceae bacterium]|nr:TAXI family TRAP transporter solute-binding subunit [Hyphomicrobiaceae bacterium]